MKYVDTHCHLNFRAFKDDYQEVIKRSFEDDIESIIIPGSRFDNSLKAVEIAEEFAKVANLSNLSRVYAAIGFHPDHLEEIENIEEEVLRFRELAKSPKVIAIGEIGLDNYYFRTGKISDTKENRTKAEEIFKAFLNLAYEVSLPVIVHSREAENETIEAIKNWKLKIENFPGGVVHCFSGSLEFAQKVLDLGFYISFTGIITYPPRRPKGSAEQAKTEELQKVVEKIPLERILIETDAPYLAPQKFRGQRNEPLYVKEIAKKIAEIKNISLEEVAKITLQNSENLFGLQ